MKPEPNDLLLQARLRTPSPSASGRPMSRQDLADAANRYLYQKKKRKAPLSDNYIGKLERGLFRWPNHDYREALRNVLNAGSDSALGFYITRPLKTAPPTQQAQQATRATPTVATLAVSTRGARAVRHQAIEVEHPDLALWDADGQVSIPARTVDDPALTGTVGDERRVLRMAAQRARSFAFGAGQTGTNSDVIDQLRDDVQRLAVAYPQRPLHGILGDLAEVQDAIFTLLERRQRPQPARQLYFLGSVVGGMLAKASHDLAEPRAAMTQARTAFLCADNADHDGLRAWLRGLQSLFAYWVGRAQESVQYAQQGTEFAARSNNTTIVWLPMNEARAWAALGNIERATSAVRRAEEAWDRVRPDDLDELGGLCTFSRTRQLYYAADALAWLPTEAAEAEQYSAQAVEAYSNTSAPEWAFGDQAGSHADLALARIARSELSGAQEALRSVLDLPPEQRINGIVHSAQRVHRAIAISPSVDSVEARDLREEIETFTRTPAAALPR